MSTAAKPSGPCLPPALPDTDDGHAPPTTHCEQRARHAEALLDACLAAAFLLTAEGRIVHANRTAADLLSDADGLWADNGCLLAARASRQVALQELVGAASAAISRSGAIALPRASGQRPLQALVAPLPVFDGAVAVPHALVLVTDPEAEVRFSDAVLAALFGFTSAEAEVANALLAGHSLEAIAALRNVALGTTRIQIKSLLRKADCRRRADLVRRLMTVPRAAYTNTERYTPLGR